MYRIGITLAKLYLKIETAIYNRTMIPYHKSMFKKCGKNVSIGRKCEFIHKNIEVGDDVLIGDRASFIASIANIKIGSHVMFGPGVTIRGGNHRTDVVGRYMKSIKDSEKLAENDGDVIIEDDVWVGCNVTILKGVTIGRGSVIGAGSVVVKSVPPYTIHIGVHDVYETKRFTEKQIEEHHALLNNVNECSKELKCNY